ncbi:MAG: M28 family peptidase, partial [Armatimonadetes bacterium]|nr:M28 family peptidase [Armatimonadota bacterium]NIM23883.1 M28 family peptidase [Armatimonadota bacterium]NIM67762.1 M28 family peptidase [Armatimonadota bacterium]NIM76271.1 M28 family peptidase [Armatimonadota bacterium]NIN05964.1 M28 family peptidase [Armatimonadota bacterium]
MQYCPYHSRRRRFIGVTFLALWMLVVLGATANALTEEEKKAAWAEIYPSITESDLQPHITYLENLGSRLAGYPGNEKAALYIADQFRRLGLKDVSKQVDPKRFGPERPYMEAFEITTPIVRFASLRLNNTDSEPVRIYPLWPNVIRTSKLPPGGVDLPLIYAGSGSLPEFSGKEVEGAAVLMEFDTGGDWLNAARLGAKAVIFVAPPKRSAGAERGEAENKFLRSPVDMPRFWISREEAWPLLARIKSQTEVEVHLECDMVWEERHSWNIIGEIPGTDPEISEETIYIEAYYDSMSIVPELAPGAEAASGVAALIELARIYKQHPPKRTVRFLVTGAHFFGLAGVRSYLSQHIHDLTVGELKSRPAKFLGLIPYTDNYREKQKIYSFCALDLSSRSRQVGIFFKGMYFDISKDEHVYDFADFGRVCRENADTIGGEHPEAAGGFIDAINVPEGKEWSNYIIGKVALDNEPFTLGGGLGVCFLTTDDSRSLVDTPFDHLEEMNLSNLARQARLLSCVLWVVANDPDMAVSISDEEPSFSRFYLDGGFSLLTGRAVQFEGKEGIVPNKVIPGTLVLVSADNTSLMGVRGDLIDMVDEEGRFTFDGIANINAQHLRKGTYLEAYHLDPSTGAIDFAPDKGPEMQLNYPTVFLLGKGRAERTIVIFPCVAITLYDLIDPQTLKSFTTAIVLDGQSNIAPTSFGYVATHPETWRSHIEDVAVVFLKKDTRFKVIMGSSGKAMGLVLLNAATIDDDHPTGTGYLADRSRTIVNIPLAAARDMHALDAKRIEKLARFRIVNENVMRL